MRLDLLPQSIELCHHELLVQACSFSLAKGKARSRVEDIVQRQDGSVQNSAGEQPVVEIDEPEMHIGLWNRLEIWVEKKQQTRCPGGGSEPRSGACGEMHEPGADADWLRERELSAQTQDE